MATTHTLNINGRPYPVALNGGETLLEVLRETLGLTGTKLGCNMGDCGACTVLVDGTPINSCLMLASEALGKEISTIEGVAKNGELAPIQKAFVNEGAIQCGYCTPGMIMSSVALLDKNPNPSIEEIKDGLAGNLCRCTGYFGIMRAVRRCDNYREDGTCAEKSGAVPATDDGSYVGDERYASVGVSIPRLDAADKAMGRALYTGDISLPRMVHGKILGSPIAHGIIKRIDTSKAMALPGVLAVITGEDVPDECFGVSPARYDEHVLAKKKVLHVGDRVAAVAAIDEKTAEKALSLIDVEYMELPPILDPFKAIAEDALQIHERYRGNINTFVDQLHGDVEKGFAESDFVKEETFVGNLTHQQPMEPQASIATWESDGTLVLYTSTQAPHYVQYMVAHVFHMPLGKIRVIRPTVGGGFGAKAGTSPLELCAPILSKMTGRPVKMVYSREEMMLFGRGRHKQYMKYKLGLDRNGKIKAFQSEIHLDGGAYASFGVATTYYAGNMMPTLYHIPNFKYKGIRVVTNKPACGAFRGHGVPQPRFAFECLLTMMAEEMGIDPIEIRRRNSMDPNTRTVNDLDIQSCEFRATLDAVQKKSGWQDKYGKLPSGQGIGIGCGGFVSGAGYAIYRGQVQMSHEKGPEHFQKKSIFPHANAVVRVTEDGMAAILMIGVADCGQGAETVMVQMCSEALGIPASRVRIRAEDSDISPIDLGAYSSRVTLMGGHAVSRAGQAVVERMKPYAAALLECDPSQVVARDAKMFADGTSRSVAWEEVARKYFNDNGPLVGTGWYKPPDGLGGDYKGATVGTSPAYSFGSSVCEASVDLETGKVKIEQFTDFHDCGTPINPMMARGQVEGAIVMGAGETIMEEILYDEKGRMMNPNLHGYLMMTIKDAPDIFSGIVESYEPAGPYGAKEIGEGTTLPVLGAVAHAIANATGVWVKELPITPERIRSALRAAGQEPGSRVKSKG